MKTSLLAYAGTFFTLLVCDGIWLGLIARNFYRDQLGALMLPSPKLAVGALVLPVLHRRDGCACRATGAVGGLYRHGVSPRCHSGTGGLCTCDITNLATLCNWPLAISLVDMARSTALTALTAVGGYLAVRFFLAETGAWR
ncbi:DUF2177 family protein [Rhizobium changzhiense]|uniref:DUF2177 family protein n=1 Tax=Rhizobium changzhiense TaxID=2692317 RepID=UPI003CCEDD70